MIATGDPTPQSGSTGNHTPTLVRAMPNVKPYAGTNLTVAETAEVRVGECDIPNSVHVGASDGRLKNGDLAMTHLPNVSESNSMIMKVTGSNSVSTEALNDGDGLGVERRMLSTPNSQIRLKMLRGRGHCDLIDDSVTAKSSAFMPDRQSTTCRAEVDQGEHPDNMANEDIERMWQNKITQLLRKRGGWSKTMGEMGKTYLGRMCQPDHPLNPHRAFDCNL